MCVKFLHAGTGKKIKSHLCQEAGRQTHTGERTLQPPRPPGLPGPKPQTAAGGAGRRRGGPEPRRLRCRCEARGRAGRLESSRLPPGKKADGRKRPARGSSGARRREKRALGLLHPQAERRGGGGRPEPLPRRARRGELRAGRRAEREPRGPGGSSASALPPSPFLSPLHPGEPHFLSVAAEGAPRGRAGRGSGRSQGW